jgi:hypothetical protein
MVPWDLVQINHGSMGPSEKSEAGSQVSYLGSTSAWMIPRSRRVAKAGSFPKFQRREPLKISWDILGSFLGGTKVIPSGYVKIAIENGHRNSGFSH